MAGVLTAVGVVSPILLAGGTKTQMLEFLRIHLPEKCFRGSNFCVNLDDALSEVTSSMSDSAVDVQTSHVIIGVQALSTIFGMKGQSFSEMKKLKEDEMKLLAEHTAKELNITAPIGKIKTKVSVYNSDKC